jgi:hypothetical protein
MTKRAITALAILGSAVALSACNDAQVVSYNLSQAADNFKIARRIVFYNGITNDYMLEIRGLCSQEQTDKKLAVTCKTGDSQYKKHFLGLSDNVTYFSEQIDGADASTQHYKITFKPSVIVPAIELR